VTLNGFRRPRTKP